MKISIIIICFILINGAFSVGTPQGETQKQLNEIASKHGLNQDDMMMILFYRLGECPSCYMSIFDEFDYVQKNRHKLPKKLLLVAFVNAERQIELKSFTKNWKFFDEVKMYKDTRKSFGLADTIIALTINGKYEVIDTFSGMEKQIFQTIKRRMK